MHMFSKLSTDANVILKNLFGSDDLPIDFRSPEDLAHGDLTTSVALRIARVKGMSPRQAAEKIAEALQKHVSIEKVEVAGAGYVNVWLKPSVLLEELKSSEHACESHAIREGEAPVIIEYSQPNIAKPLGIHHIIGTSLGQALVNLYRHAGYSVIAWNYIGDWGTQFGKLAVAYEKWGSGKPVAEYNLDELLDLYVRFHKEMETDATLEEQGRDAFRKLENGDVVLRVFWKDVVGVTKVSLEDLYEKLHVSFDLDIGESFYEDKMAPLLEDGKKKKVFVEGEGGSWIVTFPEESNLPPYLVQKSDGATLYSTRDIAQMRYRMDTYSPQAIYILTDIAQKMHFEQLVATCGQLGWELPTFENVLFGRMRFVDKSMSTRKGNVLKLEHVIEEAVARAQAIISERGETIQTDSPMELADMMGVGALVYGILSQNRKMDMVFDWEKMLSFEGNSAPYLQYTHARACSVMRKAGVVSASMPKNVSSFTSSERSLLQTLLKFSAVLDEARSEHLPHKLANFLYQLCQDFNFFYNTDSIIQSEGSTKELRLFLTSLTARVLKTGAELLTLRVPDRM